MPDPTLGEVHIDAALSGISTAYRNSNYIADQVSPRVPVKKQSDKYFEWTKDSWFRNYVQRRTPGSNYPEAGLQLSNSSYMCELFHLAYPLPDELMANQDEAVNLELAGSTWLADQFQLNREVQCIADYFATGKWTNDVVGGTNFTKWDDFATSDPIADIQLGQETVQKLTGVRPRKLIVGQDVWDRVLKIHPSIIELYKYTQVSILSIDQVKNALDVDELIVGGAIANSAQEGATFVGGYMWGKDALLAHVAKAPGLMTPSAAYTFEWDIENMNLPVVIGRIREDNRDRDLLKAKYAFDNKVVGADLGYFFSTVMD